MSITVRQAALYPKLIGRGCMSTVIRPEESTPAPAGNRFGRDVSVPLSHNPHLLRWVEKMARLTTPASIHWVDGSQQEYDALCEQMVERGTFIRLNLEL